MLKGDVNWPESRRYKSRTKWEPIGFFSDCLCNSTSFDIKLGFFSSSAINVMADGFAAFLYNGGRMRMVINDILSVEDKNAIANGLTPNILVPVFDLSDLESIKDTLSERSRHFFECLSWLIQNNRLDIKIIKPNDSDGISHCKIGMFNDGVNKVAFDGSCNFSRMALVENRESVSAFCDWDGGSDVVRIKDIEEDFVLTFEEKDDTVTYVDATNVRTRLNTTFGNKDILQLLEDEEKILEQRNTSEMPIEVALSLTRTRAKVKSIIEKIKSQEISENSTSGVKPSFPYERPRPYQVVAYNNWKRTQKGLFAMATGTGKTLTSLNCLLNIYRKFNFYKAIILVPTITLVDQWEIECRKFHFDNVVKVCSKNSKWRSELDSIKIKEGLDFADVEPSYVIIATYASFARETIFREIVSFPKKATKQILLIADEAHNMGAGRILDRLDGIKFPRRIGLSATPERQFDDIGNNAILNFFGCKNGYTFEYSMRDAIENGVLCRYYYYPHVVKLTDEEMHAYLKISAQLAKFYSYEQGGFTDYDDVLLGLLLKRKRIIHKAQNKKECFREIIMNRYREKRNLKYTLVYVPEGCEPDDRRSDIFDTYEALPDDLDADQLISQYTQIVQDISPVTTVKKFVSGTSERNKILQEFASGELEVLTSMKCLDEGVDVPRSELAIFCASTGNPRQFIQRRGRVLRTHPDKHYAVIHDIVVAPEIGTDEASYNMERNLLRGELKRVKDFAELSENADSSFSELEEILDYYNLSMFN